jgi:hypothetical protein
VLRLLYLVRLGWAWCMCLCVYADKEEQMLREIAEIKAHNAFLLARTSPKDGTPCA